MVVVAGAAAVRGVAEEEAMLAIRPMAEAVLSGLPGCTPSAYPLLAARAVVPTTPAPAATGNMFDVVMIGSNDGGGGEDDEWLYTSGAACALWCRSRRKVFRDLAAMGATTGGVVAVAMAIRDVTQMEMLMEMGPIAAVPLGRRRKGS